MKKIYIAGPLFTLAEKEFNVRLVRSLLSLTQGFEFILPQERAKKFLYLENGLRLVFEDCLATIESSNVVIGILDGPDADSGTCVELGYAYAKGIPILGVRTDFRASEELGLNLMLSNLCTVLIRDTVADTDTLAKNIVAKLECLTV